MSIAISPRGHSFLEETWQKAALLLTTTAGVIVTGVVAAINEIRKTPFIEVVLKDMDGERCVDLRFRVEGNAKQGPTNWLNMNHVTGEFLHPITGNVVNQPMVQPIPPGNPTHLVVADSQGNIVFTYRLGGKSNLGLVLNYDPTPPTEVMAKLAIRKGQTTRGSTVTRSTTEPGTTTSSPPPSLQETKLTLRIDTETLKDAAGKSLANAGAREAVVLTARDTALKVTLYVVANPSVGRFNLATELTMQQGGGEAVTLPLQETTHPYVRQVTTPTGAHHQLHYAPDQLCFTLHEVPLDGTYASQRRRWRMREYPDLQRATGELQESVAAVRKKVTVTSSVPAHPTQGQSMIVTIKTPSGKPGISSYTQLTFYYYENWGWSFIDPSTSLTPASVPSEQHLQERAGRFNKSPRTKKGINFGESRSVGPYCAYPSHPGRGLSFPYHLVINIETGNVFLINKGIEIAALTPEALGEYETRFFDRTSIAARATEEIPERGVKFETRHGQGGPFGSRRGSTSVSFLFSPVTLPLYVAEQVNWSAVKNLSLRGGVNLVNFGVPLLGGIGSEVALRGVEQLFEHQFSETTHHVGSLWGLAESGYLWGRYGAPWIQRVALGARGAIPITQKALTTTGRGTSYLHFIRALPAFEAGAFGTKWIGQEFFGVQKDSMADLALGFTGGLAIGMGSELLLQLPQFKRLTPLMTVVGLAYLAISSSTPSTYKK